MRRSFSFASLLFFIALLFLLVCSGSPDALGQTTPDTVIATLKSVTAADGSTANGTITFIKFQNGYTASGANVTIVDADGTRHNYDATLATGYIYIGGFVYTQPNYLQAIGIPANHSIYDEFCDFSFPQSAFLTGGTVHLPYSTDFSNGNNTIHTSHIISGSVSFSSQSPSPLTITTSNVPDAISGQPYSLSFTATGGQGAITWAEIGSNLPTGFTLSSGGTLSSTGSPEVPPKTYLFIVSATDSAGATVQKLYALKVNARPELVLELATTNDAKSVVLDYKVSKAPIIQPLQFQIYRSSTPDVNFYSHLIGSQTIDPASDVIDLQEGEHVVTLLSGTSLPPDPAMPYVVVVANSDGAVSEDPASVNTAHFRKYLLGGIVHGYSFSDTDTFAWMNAMKKDLLKVSNFDAVITFDWTRASVESEPNQTTYAGHDMYFALGQAAEQLKKLSSNPGDVIDLHLIGHSRGTIVLSQVLADLVIRPNPIWSGSYIEATFLDIHPANTGENNLLSYGLGLIGRGVAAFTRSFQGKVQDPEIILPSGTGLQSVDVWFQNTPSPSFSSSQYSELVTNLWGEGDLNNKIINNSGVPISWHNLTSMTYFDNGQSFLIGHTEVHEYYRLFQVDQGLVR